MTVADKAAVAAAAAVVARKLIGLIRLPIPWHQTLDGGVFEEVQHVGVDEQGQQWGLVTRATPLPGQSVGMRAMRLHHKRWVRFEAIPFSNDELLVAGEEEGKWKLQGGPTI